MPAWQHATINAPGQAGLTSHMQRCQCIDTLALDSKSEMHVCRSAFVPATHADMPLAEGQLAAPRDLDALILAGPCFWPMRIASAQS